MEIINVTQGTQDWLNARIGYLGASEAQAIATAGKGLETLVFEKVAERLTGKCKESYTNPDIERGHELEDMARSNYEIETGNKVTQVGFCKLDNFSGCSPDGLVGDDGLVEIKCKNDANYVKYLYEGKVDSEYDWQMQMQMYVTDRKWCDYVVFNQNFNKFKITRVERDEAKIEKIKAGLAKAAEMMNKIMEKVNG